MKHFFKGPLDNLKYIGKSQSDLPHSLVLDELTDIQIEQINDGYSISYANKKLVLEDKSDIEKNKKKKECKNLIENQYKLHDQINIMMFGTDEEILEMKNYIKSNLDEYRGKGKNADFSNIK